MSKDGRIWLSHTSLEVLERCPRCFWLQVNKGVRQPEGIVSRLANRYDAILKNYFDKYRVKGILPPIVEGKLPGKLQNPFVEKYFARINDKYGFYGKLDECLIDEEGRLTPVDFKTASSDPRDKETFSAYKSQMDDYVFLQKSNNKIVTGLGFLVYFFPDLGEELHNGFPMIMHIQKIEAEPENTMKRIANAIKIIEGKVPGSNEECVFCNYRNTVNSFDLDK